MLETIAIDSVGSEDDVVGTVWAATAIWIVNFLTEV
jgi:hypothetical protein